jgi:hypothetical protein
MATYYWLGRIASTGGGNVNIADNWTTLGPSGASGTIPASASTPPDNLATVIFTKFVGPGGTVYPLYSPGGTLGSGVSGTTAALQTLQLLPDCPVMLGICGQSGRTDEPFRITSYLTQITLNSGTTYSSGSSNHSHYLYFNELKSSSGFPTTDGGLYINSNVPTTLVSFRPTFRISGTLGKVSINSGSASASAYAKNIVHISGLTLTGVFTMFNDPRALVLGSLSSDDVYISNNSVITSMGLYGNSKTYISPGFGITGQIAVVGIPGGSNPLTARTPRLEFTYSATGGTGANLPTVTKVANLSIMGGNTANSAIVNVFHGIGVTLYEQNGGQINFNVPPGTTLFMSTIFDGYFNVGNSRMRSEHPTVLIGRDGAFDLKNYSSKAPDIALKGIYDVYANPMGY